MNQVVFFTVHLGPPADMVQDFRVDEFYDLHDWVSCSRHLRSRSNPIDDYPSKETTSTCSSKASGFKLIVLLVESLPMQLQINVDGLTTFLSEFYSMTGF